MDHQLGPKYVHLLKLTVIVSKLTLIFIVNFSFDNIGPNGKGKSKKILDVGLILA